MTEEEIELLKAHVQAMFERLKQVCDGLIEALLAWSETISQWLLSRIDWDKLGELVDFLRPLLYLIAYKRLKAKRGIRFSYQVSSLQSVIRLRLGLE